MKANLLDTMDEKVCKELFNQYAYLWYQAPEFFPISQKKCILHFGVRFSYRILLQNKFILNLTSFFCKAVYTTYSK